jgi:hypothetical protein
MAALLRNVVKYLSVSRHNITEDLNLQVLFYSEFPIFLMILRKTAVNSLNVGHPDVYLTYKCESNSV